MLKGFKQFLLRGNVVDLAVAVVIGAAFGAVVSALVKDLLTPLIAAIFGKPNFAALAFTVHGSRFSIGDCINAGVSFLMIATGIYFFVVVPINLYQARSRRGQATPDPTTKKCPGGRGGAVADERVSSRAMRRSGLAFVLSLAACQSGAAALRSDGGVVCPAADQLETSCPMQQQEWQAVVAGLSRACVTDADCSVVGGAATCDCDVFIGADWSGTPVGRAAYAGSSAAGLERDFLACCAGYAAHAACDVTQRTPACLDGVCGGHDANVCADAAVPAPPDAGPD
jgi:large conductance mechanosensitive channel